MTSRRAAVCLLLALAPAARGISAEPPAATPAPTAAPPVAPAPAAAAAVPLVSTVIESGALDMVSSAKETTFTYSQGVKVTATNLALTCDELVVVARRTGDPAALVGKQEKFKSMVATGHVRLVQNDREATATRAEVFPDDDKVVLSGDPVVIRSTKDGWEQTAPEAVLMRGERRAVFPSKGNMRPQTTLPPLKDLGYDKEKPKPAAKGSPANSAPADPVPAKEAPPVITVPLPPPPK